PNPFNPSTTIKYQIPVQDRNDKLFVTLSGVEESFVTIKVYDILGSEVATLVNQKQKPGNYEVTWDATDVPSGVYFYKLVSGDPESSSGQVFVEVKKMILLK
ncbi:MAG: T9SS type A sorting domain-containing protein, partial [Ignavibacteriae bacterium]|nr:T9SS type A sorting domain-containing protein [Ignavibacteriota bacterium]